MISLKDSLIGVWTLIRFEQENNQGIISYPMGEYAKGSLYYTKDEHVSVHIMQTNRTNEIEQPLPLSSISYHDLGYLAYSARFRINDVEQLVIHDIEIRLYPEWNGSHQVRATTLKDNQLELYFYQKLNEEIFLFRLLWGIG